VPPVRVPDPVQDPDQAMYVHLGAFWGCWAVDVRRLKNVALTLVCPSLSFSWGSDSV
jgi:hypothetical protein